ncbi:MAG: hypothetical protein U0136_20530 [Bdellovibrionota bacterium]
MPPGSQRGAKTTILRGEDARRRRRFLESTALVLTVVGCLGLAFTIWYTDGKVLDSSIEFLQSFESKDSQAPRDYAQNCQDPRNKNTPYCQDRMAQTESDWKSMGRTQGGKTNYFTLHK